MFYYTSKSDAQDEIERLKVDSRIGHVYTALEPNNGWVIVAMPKWYDITDLKDRCLIHSPTGVQITFPPPGAKKKMVPLEAKKGEAKKMVGEPKLRMVPLVGEAKKMVGAARLNIQEVASGTILPPWMVK